MRKLALILLLLFITPKSFNNGMGTESSGIFNNNRGSNSDVWVTEWIPSDSGTPDYAKGRFFYRTARSTFKVNVGGVYYYKYSMYFISESYYEYYAYTEGDMYIAPTKIDNATIFVNGQAQINVLTHTSDFWLLFNGDFISGVGELRAVFYMTSSEVYIELSHTNPYPF